MNNDLRGRISSDIEELKKELKVYSKRDLCKILENYINTVEKEQLDIGVAEYGTYIELLTEQINKYD